MDKIMIFQKNHPFYGNQFTKNKKSCEERFWEKVNICDEDECWEWLASKSKKGYGHFDARCGESRAHRYSWVVYFGEITDELQVLHHCDNPSCVNPKHLFLGTAKDNTQDMLKKGRDRLIGDKNGQSKLTSEKVKVARVLRKMGWTYQKIADIYNVSNATIFHAINGNTWKHI